MSYLFHFYWMDSGFFIPSGFRGHAHLLVLLRFLCWLNEHVRSLTVTGMTCRPLLTLTGVHFKTHNCRMHTYTICHRPSGPLTDRRGECEGAVKRYKFAAGNGLDHKITVTSQIPGQTPSGPTQSLWCNCPPFTRISHANSFRTSISGPQFPCWMCQRISYLQCTYFRKFTKNCTHIIKNIQYELLYGRKVLYTGLATA